MAWRGKREKIITIITGWMEKRWLDVYRGQKSWKHKVPHNESFSSYIQALLLTPYITDTSNLCYPHKYLKRALSHKSPLRLLLQIHQVCCTMVTSPAPWNPVPLDEVYVMCSGRKSGSLVKTINNFGKSLWQTNWLLIYLKWHYLPTPNSSRDHNQPLSTAINRLKHAAE